MKIGFDEVMRLQCKFLFIGQLPIMDNYLN